MILQIPFTDDGAQEFTVQLGTSKYQFVASYNEISAAWQLDIYDPVTLALLMGSIMIVIGADLLRGLGLGIGSFYAIDEGSTGLDAGPDDLGVRVNLYWFSPDEAAA